jgi:hypothetical protein
MKFLGKMDCGISNEPLKSAACGAAIWLDSAALLAARE